MTLLGRSIFLAAMAIGFIASPAFAQMTSPNPVEIPLQEAIDALKRVKDWKLPQSTGVLDEFRAALAKADAGRLDDKAIDSLQSLLAAVDCGAPPEAGDLIRDALRRRNVAAPSRSCPREAGLSQR